MASELDCIIIEYLETASNFNDIIAILCILFTSISCLQCIYIEDDYFLCILGYYEIKHDDKKSHHVPECQIISFQGRRGEVMGCRCRSCYITPRRSDYDIIITVNY